MQALDAGLAFAITMLILAMVVTTLVETLHRLFGLREKGLAILLGNFYDRILFSRSGGVLRGADDARARARRAFIEMMTINRGPVGKAPMTALNRHLSLDATSEDRKFLNWIWSGRRLGSLSLTAFMERLGGSEYGAQLVTQASTAGDKGIEWVLKDVAQKFDAFGAEASEYFESRARLLSVIVGFVLAFAINVNAIALFETFMKRPDITQAVIARGESVTKSYENLQKQVDTLNASAQAATTEEARASVQRAADEATAAVESLQSVGVPIGWNTQSVADFRRSTTAVSPRPAPGRSADRTRRTVLVQGRADAHRRSRVSTTQGRRGVSAATTTAAPRRRPPHQIRCRTRRSTRFTPRWEPRWQPES